MDTTNHQHNTHPITLIGIGADGWDSLTPHAQHTLHTATTIIGAPRQLDLLPTT
ncbi:cobalamin biosynthesis bifunctional protein CbiET, partial [Dermatophilus congolensis]|nr:cobalamin biosynthesis bifunctional protein CbiET [Dermatophilus congolensis]